MGSNPSPAGKPFQEVLSVADAVEGRRSVKLFDPDFRIPEAEVRRLLELAIKSPTAFNIQHWRFVRVRDPARRRRIRELAWDQPQMTDASLLLVLCADLKAWDKAPERYWVEAAPDVRDAMVETIRGFYGADETAQRDEGVRSCALAAMTLMLAAQEMGYDSCPMTGFDVDGVGELIKLPPNHAICMILAIGKAAQAPYPRPGQLPLKAVWHDEEFSGE